MMTDIHAPRSLEDLVDRAAQNEVLGRRALHMKLQPKTLAFALLLELQLRTQKGPSSDSLSQIADNLTREVQVFIQMMTLEPASTEPIARKGADIGLLVMRLVDAALRKR